MLEEATVGDNPELLLKLGVLVLVGEIVKVTKPEDEAELGTLGDVELLIARGMTLAPQMALLLFGVPTALFK